MRLRKGVRGLAVHPVLPDLSLADPEPSAGGVSSTSPDEGRLVCENPAEVRKRPVVLG